MLSRDTSAPAIEEQSPLPGFDKFFPRSNEWSGQVYLQRC